MKNLVISTSTIYIECRLKPLVVSTAHLCKQIQLSCYSKIGLIGFSFGIIVHIQLWKISYIISFINEDFKKNPQNTVSMPNLYTLATKHQISIFMDILTGFFIWILTWGIHPPHRVDFIGSPLGGISAWYRQWKPGKNHIIKLV